MIERPTWKEYFSNIALVTATRGDCLRAQVGCVIVKDNRIVATGYNGPPSGESSCASGSEYCPCAIDLGKHGLERSVPKEKCVALHAEQNAVAYGGRDVRGGTAYVTKAPCLPCTRLLKAAGIIDVIIV